MNTFSVPSPQSRTFWNQSWIVKEEDAFLYVGSLRGCQGGNKDQKKAKPATGQCLKADRPWFRLVLALPLTRSVTGREAWNLWMPISSSPKWDQTPSSSGHGGGSMREWAWSTWHRACYMQAQSLGLFLGLPLSFLLADTEEGDCSEMIRPTASGFIRLQILLHLKVVLKCVRWWLSLSLSRNGDREMVVLQPPAQTL